MTKPRLSLFVVPIFAILWADLVVSNSFAINAPVQQRLDKVANLPGQTFSISFSHYAGYVKVNERAGRALFYWLIEAEKEPHTKPLLLWLNGGPGCSSIAFGEAEEIGPFHIKSDGKTLFQNPYSWNKAANILFLDTPAGVGFSYTDTQSDIKNGGDNMTANDNLVFLLEWFKRFPQYKGRDFFISGESYAGHYVPQLSQVIVNHNSANKTDTINLKGYMVGNAVTDDYHDWLGYNEFLWSSGLISDQTYNQLNLRCVNDSLIKPSESCLEVLNIGFEETGDIDLYSIYTPVCRSNTSQSTLVKRKHRMIRLLEGFDPCTQEHSKVYFNLAEVQKALHVDPNHKPAKWDVCSDNVVNNWQDPPRSVLNIYRELIHSGLRIWVYSGDTDTIVPVTSTRYSIDALNLTTVKPWRAWYDGDEVGGWTQEYAGLTFAAVRGAGHEVPLHRPKAALTLVKSFLAGAPLPAAKPSAA